MEAAMRLVDKGARLREEEPARWREEEANGRGGGEADVGGGRRRYGETTTKANGGAIDVRVWVRCGWCRGR
jgi:hypothetical protein